jgi:Zn-dependent metalloprotease/PKD repeat protein
MNKKKWVFITLVFVVCCFMATSVRAAKKLDFYTANAKDYIKLLNKNKNKDVLTIGRTLGLTQDEEFKLLRKVKDFNGVTHHRYQQSFMGIPVWGINTNVGIDSSDEVVRLHGAMVLETRNDIKDVPPHASLDPLAALKQMKEQHKAKDKGAQWNFRNEKYGTYIYIDKKGKAHLCYVVSFFADTGKGNPSQWIYFVGAKTGKILDSYDMLRYQGVGPGGNLKIGYYYYGTDYGPFCVTENGSTCTMDCTDVKTVDLNHGTSGSTPFSYTCYENTHKEINGAYCPLNDAQYFGQVVFDMYNDWYGVPVLPFQLTLRCHYSTNYENAFWDGSTMTFGDGYTKFYPLVCLDVVAHETSHGFTDYNSDLIYSNQSGGINESFSDMAGEGAEYYMRGTNDFMCGYDIFKAEGEALRYLYDPPLDGVSIDHVDDYYDGMDVHYSSGVFNKAFYLIATSPGWNTRMAFDIFVRANQVYWQPSTDFQQGAEGARDAALDYGYPCVDVRNAFAAVGITIDCVGLPTANFTFTTSHLNRTVVFTDTSTCPGCTITNWDWDFGDGNTSTQQHPTHTYAADGTYTVTLTVTNSTSDTDSKSQDVTVPGPPPSVGNTEIFSSRSVSIYRRAMPFTMPETGTISSVTMYHDAGSGSMILGVYDGEGMPANRLGLTASTPLNPVADWQTIDLTGPVTVQGGTTVWLAWVYENNPGIAYKTGTPGRVESPEAWAGGMPDPYGTGTQADFLYSIFAYYTPEGGNIPPTADFTYTTTDLTVDFTDASSDPDGTIVSWDWDFGDGNTSTAQNPSHTYAAAGTYTVTLTVTDNDGATDSVSRDVTVTGPNLPPVADFTYVVTDLTVDFTDASSDPDGTVVGWDWNFGDGNTSTAQNPTHTYAAAGTYTVTLTVTDNDGATDSISKDVTVTEPGGITLTANHYKSKGVHYADLTWSGATGANVNIYRNGDLIATVANNGSYTDNLGRGVKGTFTYQVCETDGSVCSNVASITI